MTTRLLVGDCRARLAELEPGSVHAVVTSPPYLGLRDYGHADQIGLEASPAAYVEALVEVFGLVWRVLRDDGVCWLNLGDSYAATGKSGGGAQGEAWADHGADTLGPRGGKLSPAPEGLKSGDLVGIPWRVAFALQSAGWTLRSAVVWAKRAPMPESVRGWAWERCRVKVTEGGRGGNGYARMLANETPSRVATAPLAEWAACPGCPRCEATDGLVLRRGSWRPTSSYELVFMLTKGLGYFADQEAVREEATDTGRENGREGRDEHELARPPGTRPRTLARLDYSTAGRNPRDVRLLSPEPFAGAHFATMPPTLAAWCIQASTADNVCAACGAQWAPVVERVKTGRMAQAPDGWAVGRGSHDVVDHNQGARKDSAKLPETVPTILGHRSTCRCNAPAARAVVLDPFAGAGTVGLAADRLGRDSILVEINPAYADMARDRILGESPLFASVELVA